MTDNCKIWAAHHAGFDRETSERHRTNVVALPLFKEQSHTPAMMLHTMNIVDKSTKFLNPGQVPVLVADQPLYALLKQLQYLFPSKVGEDKIFIMMGGLHIEMAALKIIGQLLNGSGWVEALVQANVTTQGRGESMLTASNVVRTRYAHQVTAAALYALQKKAYQAEINDNDAQSGNFLTFEEWHSKKCVEIPQFKYWDLVLNLELLVLQFVRSTRTGDFKLYLNSIRSILPWFFSLDHVNYSRWLTIHLRDLVNLETTHPNLHKHFESGKFVARKTNKPFSGIALDQAHEQMNAVLKGDGGMIGITESPDFLQKWLLAWPVLVEMVDTYENDVMQKEINDANDIVCHHSDTAANQIRFITAVKSLESTITGLGNPFLEETTELYNIDTKVVALSEVTSTIRTIEERGEAQYLNFCKERLNSGKSLHEPIKQNKYSLFTTHHTKARKSISKTKSKITGLKNDCSLFSKLYIATCEHRTGNLESFFSHENQPTPPSLSAMGKLRSGTKADLLKSLTSLSDSTTVPIAPPVSVKILDGPAIVHLLSPSNSETFKDYADTIFIGFLNKELENVARLDIVWDRYDKDSLKNSAREKRGTGSRQRVSASTKIPKGWANFLREGTNKEELFHFLTSRAHSHFTDTTTDKEFYATNGPSVISNSTKDLKNVEPCNHEEADTRMMVHVADAVAQGYRKIMIRTVDTDVVALAVTCVPKLPQLEELWVHVDNSKNHKYISCHGIAASLGPEQSEVLAMFHAFTGCDNTSFFCGKGKKTAFETWRAYPSATEGFKLAMQGRTDQALPILEKFTIAMYDKSGSCTDVNSCRKELFTKKDRSIENLPPTQDSLKQHILRAVYQGGHVWGQLLVPQQNLPCPSDWGWTKVSDIWEPVWSTLPVASNACIELIRCKCKQKCAKRCNCIKRNLKCTELCGCGGTCAD
ncbi:uncharacterized protein LOC125240114 [Leguminivora glycinivorella]|uniref:uncharacterized protein LOC125240114 n=1 Tax=Leguminivora glycinivorella TaxID=1035111 RepID=UPI0020107690|nr:uncharacterized protein LOC125240114 [Leguminivora glycinivorella]